jgi:hypothetical protein
MSKERQYQSLNLRCVPKYSNSLFVNKCEYYTTGKFFNACVMTIDFVQNVYIVGCKTSHARMYFITLQWSLNIRTFHSHVVKLICFFNITMSIYSDSVDPSL